MFKSAKLWLGIILIVVFINGTLLMLLAGLSGAEQLGNVIAGDMDYPTYLAKMRLGYEGNWGYINRYTTEPHQSSSIFMFYILLGHLAREAGLGLAFTYHASRIILSILALLTLNWFLKKYAGDEERLAVFVLSIFISGTYVGNLDVLPQYHLYSGMMGFAHYMLTLICTLVFFDAVLEYPLSRRWRNVFAAILALNFLALVHPFMVVLVGLVGTGTVILNKNFRQSLPLLFISACSVLPLMLYFYQVFATNPVLMGWQESMVKRSPFTNFILYGVGSAYAYLAILLILGRKIPRTAYTNLCLAWLGIALSLPFTNLITSKQQWLFFACIPVAYLAYQFIKYLDNTDDFQIRFRGRSIITLILLALVILPSLGFMLNIDLWTYKVVMNKGDHYDIFIPAEDNVCYRWLAENGAKEGAVLTEDSKIGLLIPALTGHTVYLGHHLETLDFTEKTKKTQDFFAGSYTPQEALRFLTINRINYVISTQGNKLDYPILKPLLEGRNLTLYVLNWN